MVQKTLRYLIRTSDHNLLTAVIFCLKMKILPSLIQAWLVDIFRVAVSGYKCFVWRHNVSKLSGLISFICICLTEILMIPFYII